MRVFVAGATGAIGRPLVPRLIAAGHEVTGTTRSEERAGGLRAAGAEAAVLDALDEQAVRAAVELARPEVVVHQLTALPDSMDFRDEQVFEPTNRLRGEGTRILLEAARAAGARRLVAQSIAFMYAPEGGLVKQEEDPLREGGVGSSVTKTLAEMEAAVTGAKGLDGLVLRYGFFYGPGTTFAAEGSTAGEVRRRRFPVIGKGEGVFSFIHVDDAAAATVAAVEGGSPGVYNVTDDEPAPQRVWLPAYADALGARKPLRVPAWLAGMIAGRGVVGGTTQMRGAGNAKAKRELGWQPRYPSWRQGFGDALSAGGSD